MTPFLHRALGALPRGRTLPLESWERRHAWMVRAAWAHAAFLLAWAMLAYPVWHAAMLVLPIAVAAFVAGPPVLGRRERAAAVCVGLLLSSAAIVHLMDGAVEGHFHFFVIVTLLALYEDWFTYLLALSFVLLHHGVTGVSVPGAVFNHPAAIEHPWRWAGVHALFVAALSVVNVVSWRLNENARARTVDSEERFRSAFEAAPTGMALVGRDGTVQRVNAAFAAVVGVPGDELARRPLRDLVVAEDVAGRDFPAVGAACEARLRRRDGREGWGLWHHSALRDGDGTHVGWISHCIDISERKRAEADLSWQAHHDALTGLANRERFLAELNGAMERRRARPDGGRVAVLFVDVDDFKVVNDSLGHDAGDRLLAAVADRLRTVVRPGDVIARFGGDEFTVLLPGVADSREARAVADRLAAALREPLLVDGERRYVSASVGLTLGDPEELRDATALLRDADAAMYRAKALGKARCEVFDGSMRAEALERLELETALRGALERDELRLVYQPIVRLADERVVAAEALLRWYHPEHGMISPARFVPLAERIGLIGPIGAWVVHEACRQLAAFGDDELVVTVNVSALQLAAPGFVDVVVAALFESGIPAGRLCLEITETVVITDSDAVRDTMAGLKAVGVRLAVDDFGVGQASLRHLRSLLPVDTIKIDKSFVDGITGDAADAAIVHGVVRLADSLGMRAVAEGVETGEQATLLAGWGCSSAQGYHFARPMAPDDLVALLAPRRGGVRAG